MKLPFKTLQLEFANLELYENYVVATIDEGMLIDTFEKLQLYEIFDQFYRNRPFVYISNRKHDYTVNPTSYLGSEEYDQLRGMAVICYSESSYQNALFEKVFYKRPFQVFYSFPECQNWIDELLRTEKK
ncbi:MAG: hypothetical protein CMC08_08455 [Flavobacteriaceae bacterium]|nr:hypothetical protein [Flavobacteriaceae bacterium]